ncbi:MAG: carboxypeptidase regulatory-like domain-containing protein, partial [Chloroflexi bacterium]|nr:carboxypeptidase regulatory-like domain-containing protein [Chloroflexota bacterium]
MNKKLVVSLSVLIPLLVLGMMFQMAASAAGEANAPAAPAVNLPQPDEGWDSGAGAQQAYQYSSGGIGASRAVGPDGEERISSAPSREELEQRAWQNQQSEKRYEAMQEMKRSEALTEINGFKNQKADSASPAPDFKRDGPPQAVRPAYLPLPAAAYQAAKLPATIAAKAAPLIEAAEDVFTMTLGTLHRHNGFYNLGTSGFVFTNTQLTVMANFNMNFFWPNGQYASTEAYTLPPGGVQSYYLGTSPSVPNPWVGYVVITSDQTFEARIVTPDYGVVSGRVFRPDGVTPITDTVAVDVAHWPDYDWGYTANLLSDGSYYVGGLPDAQYIVRADPTTDWAKQWYNARDTQQSADILTVGGATYFTDIDFVMQPGMFINGYVYAADGVTPLENVNVDVEEGWFGVCTDVNGYYEIGRLPDGPHLVRAGGGWNWCLNQNSEYMVEYWQETPDWTLATPVTVDAGTPTVSGINFTLVEGGKITGRVLEAATGLPLENVRVNADPYYGGGPGNGDFTDSNGVYTITGLLTNDYRVRVDDANWIPAHLAIQYYDHTPFHNLATPVNATAGGLTSNINFDLQPGGTISGVITDEASGLPLENYYVVADLNEGHWGACTNAAGEYSIGNVPYTPVRVFAQGGWYSCLGQPSDYIQEYYPGVYDWNSATVLDVSAATPAFTNINIAVNVGGKIAGRVLEAATGLPLENVWVYANEYYGNNWGSGDMTDANGVYTITGLLTSDYRVRVDNQDWIPAHLAIQYYDHTPIHNLATPVHADQGGLTTGINFDLQPGGTISGTLFDAASGLPLANHFVTLDFNGGGMGQCTDANGQYTFVNVPYVPTSVWSGGDWNWCQNASSPYVREYYDGVYDQNQATWLDVNATTPNYTNINLSLDIGASITGRVLEAATGLPLENVWVYADLYYGGRNGNGDMTDANGVYTITGLLTEGYRVKVDNLDWIPAHLAIQYYDHTPRHDWATPVHVAMGGVVTNINFDLEPGGTISGLLTDSASGLPLANTRVDFPWDAGGFSICSDAAGVYTMSHLPYLQVRVSAGGRWDHCLNVQSPYIEEYYDGTYDWNLATVLNVNATTPNFTNINLALEVGGVITGTVREAATGLPLADVHVSAAVYDNEWYWGSANTDASGFYTIMGLPAEEYRVRVDDGNSIPLGLALQYYDHTDEYWLAARVPVGLGGTVGNINFDLEPGGAISGTVVDQVTGLPLANINVSADEFGGGSGTGNCTDAQGRYTLNGLPLGDYRVQAARDWNWCQQRPNDHLAEYYLEHYFEWEADPVAVNTAGQTTGNIHFTLEHGAYITGTVTNADLGGAPVAGLRVAALIPRPDYCPWCYDWVRGAERDTDVNGVYTIGPLPPGDYGIYACVNCNQPAPLLAEEYWPGVYSFDQATLVTVSGTNVYGGYDFSLDHGVVVSGIVTVPPGYSPADIQIDAWATDGAGYGAGTRTAADGSYAVAFPPMYDVRWGVSARPWGTDLGSEWAHRFWFSDGTEWNFDLEQGGEIAGRVTHNGVGVPNLNVNADNDWMGLGDNTDADGYYRITNLPPGDFRVRVDWWGNPDTMWTYYGGFEWSFADFVRVAAGQTTPNIDVEADLRGVIQGHVYESDGVTPIEGIRVVAFNGNGEWWAYSQVDGSYYMDLPAGEHKLYFEREGGWDVFLAFYPGVQSATNATVLTVPDFNTGPLVVDMEMQRMATLSGQVTNALDATGMGGVYVVAHNIDLADDFDWHWGTCTDEFGNYFLEAIPPGEVTVTASGVCGSYDTATYTTTMILNPGEGHVLDISMDYAPRPEWPLTVRSNNPYNYTPLSSYNSLYMNDADQVLPALYAPLVQLDDQGEWFSELLTQVPTLGNGGAKVVNNQLIVTYTLNAGLLWSDGEALDSGDIRFAWEMYTAVNPYLDFYLAEVSPAWKIASVTTPDAQTAVATYRAGEFPPDYLGAILYPMPEHAMAGRERWDLQNGYSFAKHPVGNGPYMIEDWLPGGYLNLVANPNYHKRALGFPVEERVRFLFTDHGFFSMGPWANAAQVSVNFTDGLPDWYQWLDLDFHNIGGWGFDMFALNNDLPQFAELEVRQALLKGFNRQSFWNEQFHYTFPAHSWLNEGNAQFSEPITRYDYDPVAAAAMLTAAGWTDHNGNGTRDKNGVELEFNQYYNEASSSRRGHCLLFQADMAALDVTVNCVGIPWDDLWEGARHGTLDAYSMGWIFDSRFDPMGFGLFHSSMIPSASNSFSFWTYSGRWQDPLNDALLEDARTQLDFAQLKTDYALENALWTAELPSLPVRSYGRIDIAHPTLVNFRPAIFTPATWNIETWELPPNPYDLMVRKTLAAGSPAPQPGVQIVYDLQVNNIGYFTVTNAGLMDMLPDDVTFVSADPAPATINGNTLTWGFGDLPPGGHASVLVTAAIPADTPHGTELVNTAMVFSDQADTNQGNDQIVHSVTVRDDVDLAVTKGGVGLQAVGERFEYYLNYANWGGAPAAGAVVTDVLPAEMSLLSTIPTPSSINGQELTWNLPDLPGNQWGGQIQINAEIVGAGNVINNAAVGYAGAEPNLANNNASFARTVDEILAPVMLRPTRGVTDMTPTVSGLAPSGSLVEVYDIAALIQAQVLHLPFMPEAVWLGSTTATVTGTFSLELNLV